PKNNPHRPVSCSMAPPAFLKTPPRPPGGACVAAPPAGEKTSEARQFFRHQVSKQSFKPGNSFSFLHQK
ncbi:hypothetical protein OTG57_22780, partial [Escherichia coli]|uniref:hypothetical protein n=1 Tax=Escherichia coli TaxID=562 RepID=UPI00226549F5